MFSYIAGVPAHPLYIHLAVVSAPLAALLALITAARPHRSTRWYAGAGVVVAVAAVAMQFAKSSGEELLKLAGASEKHPGKAETHANLGEWSLYAVLVMALAFAALAFLRWRAAGRASAVSAPATATALGGPQAPGAAPSVEAQPGSSAARATGPLFAASRVILALAALASLGLVLWAGHAGASLTWEQLPNLTP